MARKSGAERAAIIKKLALKVSTSIITRGMKRLITKNAIAKTIHSQWLKKVGLIISTATSLKIRAIQKMSKTVEG